MLPCLLLMLMLSPAPAFYNVRDYGAKGDGTTRDTFAIQLAIDAAAREGAGVVLVPAGNYRCGTIHLRSYITLSLMSRATLILSKDVNDFDPYEAPPAGSLVVLRATAPFVKPFNKPPGGARNMARVPETVDNQLTTYFHYALLAGDKVSHIAIDGFGVIDGNRSGRGGPKTIALKQCDHISIRNITVRNAPSYSVSLLGCDYIDIYGLTITNGYADGIDPDGCRYVRIANCYIDVWDDAICAKASLALGRRRSTEHLTVSDCILRTSCNNFKFGTESEGDLKDVTLHNCAMLRRDTDRAPVAGIAIESVDGGVVDRVVVSNVTMRNVRTPIFIRLGVRGRGMMCPKPGAMINITIRDVIALGAALPCSITGLPDSPIRNITLENINIIQAGGTGAFTNSNVPELPSSYPDAEMFGLLPAWSIYARHVLGLRIANWKARRERADPRPAATFDDVVDLDLADFRTDNASASRSFIWLQNVDRAMPTLR